MHGGAPSALFATVCETHDPGPAAFVARVTVELMRPVPLAPLELRVRTIRPGRKVQWIEAMLLADALGLKMLTPYSFLKAISEGSEVSAGDKATIDQQIKGKQIKVYIYNSQNSTPDIAAQVKAAKAAGIPVTTVTETLSPAGATFQQWQTTQLQGIEQVLAQATGK